jgi:Tol biopolymer transport system component
MSRSRAGALRPRRSRRQARAIGAALIGLGLSAAALHATTADGRAGATSEIVFVTEQAGSNGGGEIYALKPGSPPKDISASPFADTGMAVAPRADRVAFWSNRSGAWHVYLARSDGSDLRPVPGATLKDGPGSGELLFSPDGQRLLLSSGRLPSLELAFAIFDLKTGVARRYISRCEAPPSWSPDGQLLACLTAPGAGNVGKTVSVVDVTGRLRFSVPGTSPVWSAGGLLAVTDGKQTRVLTQSGTPVARLVGAAEGWSPDGRLLALARPGELVLRTLRGARPLRIIRGPHEWTPYASFTPDSRFVVYYAPDEAQEITPVSGGPSRRLPGFEGHWSATGQYAYLDPIDDRTIAIDVGDRFGRAPKELARFPYDGHGDQSLVWLPDGSGLLYEWSARSQHSLWAVNPDGSGLHRLTSGQTDDQSPAWSRDGTRLAYTSATFDGGSCGFCDPQVIIADSAGRNLSTVALAPDNSGDYAPSWSPDDTRLVVSHCCSGELDVVALNSGKRTKLAVNYGTAPAWSPDGSTIAYLGTGAIATVDPTGAHHRQLLASSPDHSDITGIAWSPDSRQLAFSTQTALYLLPTDGNSPPRRIASATAGVPSFSPDGTQLAFAAPPTDHASPGKDILVVNTDGSNLHPIVTSPYDDYAPAWQPAP